MSSVTTRLTYLIASLLILLCPSDAFPNNPHYEALPSKLDSTHVPPRLTIKREVGGGLPLKVLPVGDSITEGFQSSNGNGYRLALRNLITSGGASTLCVDRAALCGTSADML